MRKAVFLVRIETLEKPWVPYGLLYVANALKQTGFTPRIFHLHGTDLRSFEAALDESQPLFVGFGPWTDPGLHGTLEASRLVHSKGIPVIWGSIHPSFLPQLCLKEPDVDYVVIGEGEETIVEFAQELQQNGKQFGRVRGLAFKQDGEVRINPERELLKNLDQYYPEVELLDFSWYFQTMFGGKLVLPVITSRGCPFKCTFCYNQAFNKQRIRYHSSEFSLDLIRYLQHKYQIEGVFFSDDLFMVTKSSPSRQLVETMKLPWFAELRAELFDREFCKWLKEFQCKKVLIGAESGSQRILDIMQKKIKVAQIEEAARNLGEVNIDGHFSFIIGYPEETPDDLKQTLRLVEKLQKINPRAECAVKILTPYPGTPVYISAVEAGFVPPNSTAEWASFERHVGKLPWIPVKKYEAISRLSDYTCTGRRPRSMKSTPFFYLGRLRWKYSYFGLPIDIKLFYFLAHVKSRVIQAVTRIFTRWNRTWNRPSESPVFNRDPA